MARAARDFRVWWGRHLLPARSDFGPGTARRPPGRQEMQRHRARALCDHRRPCWQRSGRSCIASPEPCPWVRPQPPTRHSQARLAVHFALPSPQCSPTPPPSFSCDGHSPCCRRRRRRSSAGSSSSPPASKRMCGPGASASAHLAPWKGHRRCTFHRRRPPAPSAAIVTKNSSLRQRMRSSRQLRFAFSARYWAAYEPFHGFTPYFCNTSNNGSKKASDL